MNQLVSMPGFVFWLATGHQSSTVVKLGLQTVDGRTFIDRKYVDTLNVVVGQNPAELSWMTRHALRTLVKQGHPEALRLLGFDPEADIAVTVGLGAPSVPIGAVLDIRCELLAEKSCKVLVDYVLHFHRPGGHTGRKVFKLKQGQVKAGAPLILSKKHPLKGNATTFTLHPGPHRIELQVNGRVRAGADFELLP